MNCHKCKAQVFKGKESDGSEVTIDFMPSDNGGWILLDNKGTLLKLDTKFDAENVRAKGLHTYTEHDCRQHVQF